MLPEISRRCLSCGAAVRAGARFCPQCGKEMGAAGVERPAEQDGAGEASEAARSTEASPEPLSLPPPAQPAPMPTTRDAEASFEAPPKKEFEAFSEGVGLKTTRDVASDVALEDAGAAPEVRAEAAETGARVGAGEVGRVARVREGTRARVGKMREEALVVLEDAPDDSGMRFVVLAVAAFLLFVVVLFLSTTVLR